MWLYRSSSRDVFENLALEDLVLDRAGTLGPGLMVYRNTPSVVLGKNQVPWRECDPAWLHAEGICLARRISGGGTVYHDEGNLNLSFFLPRNAYSDAAIYDLMINALRECGIEASLANANSLVTSAGKVSGQAFCYRKDAVLHHASLLLSSDLIRLEAALRPRFDKVETRAIASRRSTVTNLADQVPVLDGETVLTHLLAYAERDFGSVMALDTCPVEKDVLEKRTAVFSSWDWVYGRTPRFHVVLDDGTELDVRRGLVEEGFVTHAGRRFDEVLAGIPKQG